MYRTEAISGLPIKLQHQEPSHLLLSEFGGHQSIKILSSHFSFGLSEFEAHQASNILCIHCYSYFGLSEFKWHNSLKNCPFIVNFIWDFQRLEASIAELRSSLSSSVEVRQQADGREDLTQVGSILYYIETERLSHWLHRWGAFCNYIDTVSLSQWLHYLSQALWKAITLIAYLYCQIHEICWRWLILVNTSSATKQLPWYRWVSARKL